MYPIVYRVLWWFISHNSINYFLPFCQNGSVDLLRLASHTLLGHVAKRARARLRALRSSAAPQGIPYDETSGFWLRYLTLVSRGLGQCFQ